MVQAVHLAGLPFGVFLFFLSSLLLLSTPPPTPATLAPFPTRGLTPWCAYSWGLSRCFCPAPGPQFSPHFSVPYALLRFPGKLIFSSSWCLGVRRFCCPPLPPHPQPQPWSPLVASSSARGATTQPTVWLGKPGRSFLECLSLIPQDQPSGDFCPALLLTTSAQLSHTVPPHLRTNLSTATSS